MPNYSLTVEGCVFEINLLVMHDVNLAIPEAAEFDQVISLQQVILINASCSHHRRVSFLPNLGHCLSFVLVLIG